MSDKTPETSEDLAHEISNYIDAYVTRRVAAFWEHVFQGMEEPCACENHRKLAAYVARRVLEARRRKP